MKLQVELSFDEFTSLTVFLAEGITVWQGGSPPDDLEPEAPEQVAPATVTREDVGDQARNLRFAKGDTAVKTVLRTKLGVARISEIPDDQLPYAYALLQKEVLK